MSNIFEAAVRNEATLRAALADADIAPMLMVLSQLSGDLDILEKLRRTSTVPGASSKRCRRI